MAELFQIYTEGGEPLNAFATKDEIHDRGLWFGGAHVWIWTRWDGPLEFLIQRRAEHKTWGGKLDISVAGHILHGVTPELAVIQEVREELDITLEPSQLKTISQTRDTALIQDGRSKS
jgi:isopentenyldiphosphate isomerase